MKQSPNSTEALVHLRVPAATKGRWIRASRVAGMRLTDWIISAIAEYEMHQQLITIKNAGPDIVSTNYWQTEYATRGLCYLTANAGVLRLLVPDSAASMITEMNTGRSVTIEPSISVQGAVDIIFEDGTDTPFSLTLDERQSDRIITPGKCKLSVWTQLGKVSCFDCDIV